MSDPTDLQVVELDHRDDDQVDAWYSVYAAAEGALPPGVASTWQLEEVRATAQEGGSARWRQGYLGRLGDRVVAAGWIEFPLRDNTERAELMVHVHPDHQRRGHGSAVLARLEQVARERGRTVLAGEAPWAYDAGPEGIGEPAAEFARRHGYTLALGDVKRRLDLPVAADVLDALAAEAAPHHPSYELRSWGGPVPEELVDGWARLVATLNVEAPQGDLEIEAESLDPAQVRENEELLVRQGRVKYNTVALDASGELVGYTDIATTVHEPGRSYQWGTLVRPDHRGHRLGLALKVANLRLLQRERPDIVEVTTYNAEVNAPMVGVNDRLGFRKVARLGELQKLV
ncbi:GNAT family N-acetyltransferase [Nocardioides mangrovi]|uniref:GNAT family N-acetyltransferase n=1 Tax=Nocardioides mangrovi TaxID=2874580 RepID=A0ABS7UFB0_9ACTN|nr:GNAT family N-acetyltransferase [Nocardioides mangrovi]MBZ5739683.1 GNAT family N-acetyltransferase [Nocardioides mangrovi]